MGSASAQEAQNAAGANRDADPIPSASIRMGKEAMSCNCLLVGIT